MAKNKKYYIFEMNLLTLNILSIFLLFIFILLTYLIDKDLLTSSFLFIMENIKTFIILMIIYMIIHEILHSIAYCIYGANFKNIVYGMKLEKGVFYCLCKQNITKLNILNSLLYPLFYIGIITYIIGIIFKEPLLLWLSIFNLSGCSGDIIMFIFISKLPKTIEFTELDDCTSFAIHSNIDISKYKHTGLKYKENTQEIQRADLKKITISKFTYIFLITCLLLVIFI